MSISVIAGLGNPGSGYRNTRHNIGFDLIDHIAEQHNVAWKANALFEAQTAFVQLEKRKIMLLKPTTFMNHSGKSISATLRYLKLSRKSLLVIHDDLTLELGRSKLSISGSSGGHNGIENLLMQVGDGFARYRIGIGSKQNKEMNLADYVLSKFNKNEQTTLAGYLTTYIDHFNLILNNGLVVAMNSINQRKSTLHEPNDKKNL